MYEGDVPISLPDTLDALGKRVLVDLGGVEGDDVAAGVGHGRDAGIHVLDVTSSCLALDVLWSEGVSMGCFPEPASPGGLGGYIPLRSSMEKAETAATSATKVARVNCMLTVVGRDGLG